MIAICAQVAFALPFFAGEVKANPWMSWVPFDLTGATCALVVSLAIVSLLLANGKISTQILWVLGFYLSASVAVAWTDWTPYAIEKASRFFSVTLIVGTLPAVILTEFRALKRFISSLIVIEVALSFAALIQLRNGELFLQNGEFSGLTGTYISLGRDAGMALVGLYAMNLSAVKKKILPILLCPFLFLTVVASGARGPLIILFGVLVFVTLRWSVKNGRSIAVSLLLVAAGGWILVGSTTSLPQRSLERIALFLEHREDDDARERLLLAETAIHEIVQHPLGVGFGNFGEASRLGMTTERLHPHNIFLDAAVDNGIFAALVLLCISGTAVIRSYKVASVDAEFRPFFAMLLLTLCNALVSGDLNDNRLAFAMLAIGLMTPMMHVKNLIGRSPKADVAYARF